MTGPRLHLRGVVLPDGEERDVFVGADRRISFEAAAGDARTLAQGVFLVPGLVDAHAHLTIASDLHNNTFGLGVLERAANGGPVLFAGDLTDRGSPLETSVVRRTVRLGRPFVFVTGNHDSDFLAHELASEGAIVLTRRGRLMPKGGFGPMIYKLKLLKRPRERLAFLSATISLTNYLECSPRSGRQHKAWGGAQRNPRQGKPN